jgi:hypothetical protein
MLLLACALLSLSPASSLAPPRVIIFSLGDDYGFNNVGYEHGPLSKGNPEMKTPTLDRLAMGGVRLERHYVRTISAVTISPLTLPFARSTNIAPRHGTISACCNATSHIIFVRSAFLSGRLPVHVNQNNACNDVTSESGVDLRMTLIPEKLKSAGYRTVMSGRSLGCSMPSLAALADAPTPLRKVALWRAQPG